MRDPAARLQLQTEALDRARAGQSLTNYPAVIVGFIAKGIAADDIQPRVNVLTYNAWLAAGRQVRRGEHGVRVVTFIDVARERDGKAEHYRRPHAATVFHVSQTDPIGDVA